MLTIDSILYSLYDDQCDNVEQGLQGGFYGAVWLMTFLLCLGFLILTFLLGNDKLTIKGSRDTGCFFWPRGVFDRGLI